MAASNEKTLRLIFPQWQGGNTPLCYLGSKLLAWLAPAANRPIEDVPVALPSDTPLPLEAGVVARSALRAHLCEARRLTDKHQPERLVVLGGDCLVDLAPFAYLNERYDGELAVLWLDAHPDIMTPTQFQHAHAMVLGNMLGHGDADFAAAVSMPIKSQNVLFVGPYDPSNWEAKEIEHLGLRSVGHEDLLLKGN